MAPRILLCWAALLALAGCGAEEDEPTRPAAPTELTVQLDRDGKGPEPARKARFRCPEGDSRACAAARDLRPADFEPTPGNVACTEQFGGPQTATIEGTLNRRAVRGRFSRENGCAIARWDKVAPLLEAAS